MSQNGGMEVPKQKEVQEGKENFFINSQYKLLWVENMDKIFAENFGGS